MTAVYAYAHENVAFVAADTLRMGQCGMPFRVCKVHHWSDKVLLAQAGEARFLTELIGKILPLRGFFPGTDDGFFDAFRQLSSGFWDKAQSEYSKRAQPMPDGTVLVAAAADTKTARIHKVDFRTGDATLCQGRLEADGTDPAQFRADAEKHFLSLKSGQDDSDIQLDRWASLCIEDAVKRYDRFISYPLDALLARESEAERVLVQRRMQNRASQPIDLFKVP